MRSSGTSLSRRQFCLCCVAATAFTASSGWLSPRETYAGARGIVDMIRDSAVKAPITVHKLRGNISVLEGSGGNIGVIVGRDGKVLIDAGITASKPRIETALAGLGAMPITHLINTHWHFDHADGNEWLAGEGAEILAHENTRRHLSSAQRVEDWAFDFPAAPHAAVPTKVFAKNETIKVDLATIHLRHQPAAHTDGDITVHFEEADVIHAGDIYWNGIYPFIDYSTGGGIDGTIAGAEAILALAKDGTIIIPGHGRPVSNRKELQSYREAEGRSLEEIVAAGPTRKFDAEWGQFVIGPAFFTKLVHEGV
jgi:glyoxylase-like metal-dependent hydrolase (beta-lactamase superfamily II)